MSRQKHWRPKPQDTEQGFMLIGVIVLCFLVLLALSVAAPTVAHELRRDKEVESVHRANQYVRAIQLYYRKFGHYPSSIDQLEKSNNIRFLRQKYADPLTGKADWKLIHVGEAKTTVKGFFGQPLAGIATSGITGASNPGSSIGGTSGTGATGAGSSSFGISGSSGPGGFGASNSASGTSNNTSANGTSSNGTAGPGSSGTGAAGSDPGATGSSSSSGMSSTSATTFSGGGAPIIGVGSQKPGDSIVEPNEQTTYNTWEFLYDPRIEQLKAKGALQGSGPTSMGSGNSGSSANSFGSSNGTSTGASAPGTTTPGTSGSSGSTPTP